MSSGTYYDTYGDYYDTLWDNTGDRGREFLENEVGLLPGEFKEWCTDTGWNSPHTFLSEAIRRSPRVYSALADKLKAWQAITDEILSISTPG